MFLAVDIGNSSVKCAVFDKDIIVNSFCFDLFKENESEYYEQKIKETLKNTFINECAIISVVKNVDKIIKAVCDSIWGIESFIITPDLSREISINTNNPQGVGMDRVANLYAVIDCALPAIVVDIGTAVTFDILSEKKEFIGGIIMPGINMQLKGLASKTSKLPMIEPEVSYSAIGTDTKTNILSGVIRGTACAIDGLLSQCAEELGDCKTVILTGGQAELISKYMKYPFDKIAKHLTISGIKRIYDDYRKLELSEH